MAHGVVDTTKNTTIMISREARAELHTIQRPRETLGNVVDRLIKKFKEPMVR
jgi:predicted CopG family antitoxin